MSYAIKSLDLPGYASPHSKFVHIDSHVLLCGSWKVFGNLTKISELLWQSVIWTCISQSEILTTAYHTCFATVAVIEQ